MNRPLRILCVEDHPDMCELIATVLSGFEVISESTRGGALEQIHSGKAYSLYILDYHLPDGNGLQLSRDIRTVDSRTPILFVTGSSNITMSDVRDAGGQSLLKKGSPDFTLRLMEIASDLCSLS